MRGGCQFRRQLLDLGVQIAPAVEMRGNDAAKLVDCRGRNPRVFS
jgi:hypothetical protein